MWISFVLANMYAESAHDLDVYIRCKYVLGIAVRKGSSWLHDQQ